MAIHRGSKRCQGWCQVPGYSEVPGITSRLCITSCDIAIRGTLDVVSEWAPLGEKAGAVVY